MVRKMPAVVYVAVSGVKMQNLSSDLHQCCHLIELMAWKNNGKLWHEFLISAVACMTNKAMKLCFQVA